MHGSTVYLFKVCSINMFIVCKWKKWMMEWYEKMIIKLNKWNNVSWIDRLILLKITYLLYNIYLLLSLVNRYLPVLLYCVGPIIQYPRRPYFRGVKTLISFLENQPTYTKINFIYVESVFIYLLFLVNQLVFNHIINLELIWEISHCHKI